jgi:hypothetical protein
MITPVFEDTFKTFTANGFSVTNEESAVLKELLGRRTFKKTAAICSGGEMLFFLFLPCSKSVVAIDHSYNSLRAAYLKALLLDTLGAKNLHDLLMTGDKDLLAGALNKVAKLLPKPLVPAEKYKYPNYPPPPLPDAIRDLRKEWHRISVTTLEKAKSRLKSLAFVHGDLSDVASKGPFDLVYISNALEHVDRTGKNPEVAKVLELVAPGGYLLLTTGDYKPLLTHSSLTLVKSIKGFYTTWQHCLYQKKDEVVPAKPKEQSDANITQ